MKTYKLLAGCLTFLAVSFASCSSSDIEELDPNEQTQVEDGFVEAPKCEGTVTVRTVEGSRAASSLDPSIDRLTATRCDVEDDNYTLVSYHGRNKEEIGMVQVINHKTNTVVSELYFEDARVNYCAFYNKYGKQCAYVGVDRSSKKERSQICGIVAIPMKNGKFDIGNGSIEVQPYSVEGVSVNCIKFVEQTSVYNKSFESAMVVASGGNNHLAGTNRMAGFTKFKINKDKPSMLEQPVTGANIMMKENFRGYWISHNKETESSVKLPVAYTYRTTEGNDLVYKLAVVINDDNLGKKIFDFFDATKSFGEPDAEVEVMRRYSTTEDKAEDFGRYSVSMMVLNTARFLIVSTGSKILDGTVGTGGGTRVYRLDHNGGNVKLVEVDVWNKACYNTSNKNVELGDPYIYAACAELGVMKCKVEYDKAQKSQQTIRLLPVAKRVTSVLTESGTKASTNYVQCNLNMKKINVAGGYEGYYTLDLDDAQFTPADPRESYESNESNE